MAIDIVDFPMKNDGSFHSYVKLPEGKRYLWPWQLGWHNARRQAHQEKSLVEPKSLVRSSNMAIFWVPSGYD